MGKVSNTTMIVNMLTTLLYPFVALSALGLILSLVVHYATMFGLPVPEAAVLLFPGIFVVWFPTVITANLVTRRSKRRDFWKIALRGAPKWMQYMVYGFFIYAIINFIFFIVFVRGGTKDTSESMFRVMSGHALPFYAAALGILYSATQIQESGLIRKCPNGHEVSFLAKYCEECGQPILEDIK